MIRPSLIFNGLHLLPVLLLCGCSSGGDSSVPSGLSVQVQYQQQPLADVHVMLYEQAGRPLVLEGWTAENGTAELTIPAGSSFSANKSAAEQFEFVASVSSISDGGWILQPKYSKAANSELTVSFQKGEKQALLELPKDAVKPL